MELKKAQELAIAVCRKLAPHCEPHRINIVGSTRRRVPNPGDLEVICIPQKKLVREIEDLFGSYVTREFVLPEFTEAVESLGQVIKGKPDGRHMKILLPEGVNLDLFMPQPEDYYRQFCVRTGDSQYSHYTLASGWKQKGWCGTSDGLRKISQCKEHKGADGKSIWKCVVPNPEKPPSWDSEISFFNWLGIPYREPHKRFM